MMRKLQTLLAVLAALLLGATAIGGGLYLHRDLRSAFTRQAGEIAELRAALTIVSRKFIEPPAAPAVDGAALDALTARLARLEAAAAMAAAPIVSASVADAAPTDCIPLGTRFLAAAGDGFAICDTGLTIKVTSVDEGHAVIEGAGPIPTGGITRLAVPGCTLTLVGADLTGFAEMRVTCT